MRSARPRHGSPRKRVPPCRPALRITTQSQVPSGRQPPRQHDMRLVILASSGHYMPHGQAGGGSRPPGSAPLHRRPPRRPPPTAKKLRAPACGIMFVPHIMPPAPRRLPTRRVRKALRESLTCRRRRTLAQPPPGANGVKRCPRHSRRFLRSYRRSVQLGRSCGNA